MFPMLALSSICNIDNIDIKTQVTTPKQTWQSVQVYDRKKKIKNTCVRSSQPTTVGKSVLEITPGTDKI